jgi:lambda repressor-like predicted transcriptional regulator
VNYLATSPTTIDWHPADIVAALRKTRHKWSLRGLSVARGYSSNAASVALHKPWAEVESIIADALREFGIAAAVASITSRACPTRHALRS